MERAVSRGSANGRIPGDSPLSLGCPTPEVQGEIRSILEFIRKPCAKRLGLLGFICWEPQLHCPVEVSLRASGLSRFRLNDSEVKIQQSVVSSEVDCLFHLLDSGCEVILLKRNH